MAEFNSTPFAKQLLRRQMAWRTRTEAPTNPPGRLGPMLDNWRDGLHSSYRDMVTDFVKSAEIRIHSHACALNSSMVFAFNLFAPFIANNDLTAWLPVECGIRRVTSVELEWLPHGDLLAEIKGAEPVGREPSTAIDVLIRGEQNNGAPVAILVEVKLSEGGFTRCGGRNSRGNSRQDICQDGALFLEKPADCYLNRPQRATRDRRYWPILRNRYGSVRGAIVNDYDVKACPFAEDANQLMRQHALAIALEDTGSVAQAWVALVHHDENPDVLRAWSDAMSMFNPEARFFRRPASTVLRHAKHHGSGEWTKWMAERYALEIRQ